MMTSVYCEKIHTHFHIQANNHADDPAVCAAVSMMMQSLYAALTETGCTIHKVRMNPGHALVDFTSKDAAPAAYYHMASLGLKCLAESYPDHVQVTEYTE